MTSNLWKLDRTNIPESMGCSGTALIFLLTKYTQPWQRINLVEKFLQQCGIEPFAEVLGVPNSGIFRENIPESVRKPHPNLLFRALAIQALGKVRDELISSEREARASDFSKNLLAALEQEARGGSTPLMRWSAAVSIKSLWLDEAGQQQGKEGAVNVTINAGEIERLAVEEQIKLLAINKFAVGDSRNDSSKEYENCLDFWVYGPSWLLPGLPMDCDEYLFWIDRVFAAIALRGHYKLNAENDAAVTNFLGVAENNFNDLEFSKILAKIFEFLHHPEAKVKNLAAIILAPYKDKLDRKLALILRALVYKFNVKYQPLESLTIPEIEEYKASLYFGQMEIDDLYCEALALCGNRDVELASLLSAKQREYQHTLEEYINNLSKLVKSIINCQSLLDANKELLYLTVDRLEKWDYTLDNKLAAHRKKIQNLSLDKSTSVQCINLDNELNYIRDSLQYTLYEVTSNINSQIRELELSASKNSKTATDMFRWTWLLFAVGFSGGLFLYLSDLVINWIFGVSYTSEFLVYWTIVFSVMVVFLLVLAVFFSALAALYQRRESKLIPQFDSLSQIGSSFSILWQKIYLQQFVPSVRSN
ncbi:hypothetical protein Osc7112_3954 [Oscillatoria nigro-viridis PCC 7112]|uniref:Uncharacterized protein n=1 Tax=Phormidium nigroviride PCC 7112 TaxID=179408 RepID=K9VK05_9CYAN|nr:hypothetical protein [Oscillatoria nigro-viridis]AFZ08291.1 hypothetical protein Osc7112_3954 [Oscillatoria nigro-viridis PCC 7112]